MAGCRSWPPDGTVLWHYGLADDTFQQHHDVEPLPNGNLLVITWERIAAADAIARGRDPEQVGVAGLWPDAIFEVKPTPPEGGEVVWKWRAWDHLIQDFDPDLPGYGSIPDHPERIDINADHRDAPPLTEEQKRKRAELEEQLEALGLRRGRRCRRRRGRRRAAEPAQPPRPQWRLAPRQLGRLPPGVRADRPQHPPASTRSG